jgi:DNA polymerase-3 subunit delta
MGELHLVHGSDEALVGQAVVELVRRLVGDADRSLMVADLTIDGEEVTVGHLVSECQTPPFLTDRRVVVGRDAQQLGADAVPALVAYLGEPLPSTDLVLVYQGKPTKKLLDAVKSAGGTVVGADVGSNRKERAGFVEEQVAASGLRLSAGALMSVTDQLGEDVNRLAGLLETLVATFGPSSGRLEVDDVAPVLGDAGGIPPWDLTDAIDRGDRVVALGALARMTRAGGRHPLQVMAVLHTHYGRLLRLDGSGARDEVAAGEVLGVKGFAARKALDRARVMGPEATHEAIQLLCRADLDLRGQRELPDDAVLEVLVARLCRLSGSRRAAPVRR